MGASKSSDGRAASPARGRAASPGGRAARRSPTTRMPRPWTSIRRRRGSRRRRSPNFRALGRRVGGGGGAGRGAARGGEGTNKSGTAGPVDPAAPELPGAARADVARREAAARRLGRDQPPARPRDEPAAAGGRATRQRRRRRHADAVEFRPRPNVVAAVGRRGPSPRPASPRSGREEDDRLAARRLLGHRVHQLVALRRQLTARSLVQYLSRWRGARSRSAGAAVDSARDHHDALEARLAGYHARADDLAAQAAARADWVAILRSLAAALDHKSVVVWFARWQRGALAVGAAEMAAAHAADLSDRRSDERSSPSGSASAATRWPARGR